jgi:hypothetical protein
VRAHPQGHTSQRLVAIAIVSPSAMTLNQKLYRSREKLPRSGLVACLACSIAWGWKSPSQPDGGEGLAKRKGITARRCLKEVRSKTAT